VTEDVCALLGPVDVLTADDLLHPAAADTALLDPEFLGSALPIAIDWLTERALSDAARSAARAIRRVLPRLDDTEPAERLAYLLFAARTADAPELAAAIEAGGRAPAWSTEWAKWRPSLPTRQLNGAFDPARAVVVGRLHGSQVVAAVFAPGGQPGKRALGAWAIANGDEIGNYRQVRLDTTEELRCLALGNAGGEVIVLGYDDGAVHLLDASARRVRSRLTAHSGAVVAVGLLVAGDRTMVLSAGDDSVVQVSDPANGESLRTIRTDASVCTAAFGVVDNRPVAVTGGRDGTVRSWDPVTGQPFASPPTGHDGPVTAVALGTAGSPVVVSGGADGTVRIWEAATGAPIGDPLVGHAGAVTAVACVAVDGCPTVVSGGADRTVRYWSLTASPPVEAYRQYVPGPVDALAAAGHRRRPALVVAARSARLVCYDLAHGFPLPGPPNPGRGPVRALATGEIAGRPVVAVGGGTAAFDTPTTGADADPPFARRGVVDVLDLATGAVVASVAGHERRVGAVALGPAGPSTVLAAAGDGTIRLWDAATGAATAGPLPDIPDAGTRQRWHARLLVLGGGAGHPMLMADGTNRLVRVDENSGERTGTNAMALGFWSGIDGRPLGAKILVGVRTDVSALAAGEINGHLVYGIGFRNGTVVVVFDGGVPPDQPPPELPPVGEDEPRKAVVAIAFGVAADRALIAVARCGRVDLVDCTTGQPAGSLVGHRGEVRALAFGRAGDRPVIVTGGADGTVRLWDPATKRANADGTVRPVDILSIDVGDRVNALACPGGEGRLVVGTDAGVVAITLDG
jgi:WD40 repeat protein